MAQSSQPEAEQVQRQTKTAKTTVIMRRRKITFTRVYPVTRGDPSLFPDSLWEGMRKKIGNARLPCARRNYAKNAADGKPGSAERLNVRPVIGTADRDDRRSTRSSEN